MLWLVYFWIFSLFYDFFSLHFNMLTLYSCFESIQFCRFAIIPQVLKNNSRLFDLSLICTFLLRWLFLLFFVSHFQKTLKAFLHISFVMFLRCFLFLRNFLGFDTWDAFNSFCNLTSSAASFSNSSRTFGPFVPSWKYFRYLAVISLFLVSKSLWFAKAKIKKVAKKRKIKRCFIFES